MRVLHVMTRMSAGGTEVQLLGMLKAAHGKHWDATLCVLSDGWALSDQVAEAGIPVVVLDGRNTFDPRRILAFRKLVSSYEVVHSSLPGANAFSRVSLVGRSQPAIVISERGVDDERSSLRRMTDRALRPKTDAYIGNSRDVTDFIRSSHRLGPDDLRVFEVGNGMDLGIFTPGQPDASTSKKRIITAGRLVPGKRVDLAIDVFRQLHTTTEEVEMIVAGDGPERPALERRAQGLPITFVGHVTDRASMARHLRRADVFLMTSIAEGLPNALLEALACGVPVVAADVPGIRAAAGSGVRLVDGGIHAWNSALVEALGQGRQQESLVGPRVISFDSVALRHLQVFERAAERRQEGASRRRRDQRRSTYQEVRWPIRSTLSED